MDQGENMIKDNFVFCLEKGTLRIIIIDEINHHNVAKMREKIDEKIRELSPEKVVLDLSQLNFMDSSGFGFIIGRMRVLQETQAELVIENPSFVILGCNINSILCLAPRAQAVEISSSVITIPSRTTRIFAWRATLPSLT